MSWGEREYQPSTCKKCGDSGFYYPNPWDNTGKFDKIDHYEKVIAFDPKYNVPHWYVCPSNPKGLENRRKIEDSRKIGSGQSTIEKSLETVVPQTPSSSSNQNNDTQLNKILEELTELKRMVRILVQRTEPVG